MLLVLLLAACAGAGGGPGADPFRRGVWPLFTGDALPWAGVRETRALGPILHREDQGESGLFEARPFFSSLALPEQQRWDLLYPLAGCRARSDRRVCSLLLLFGQRTDRAHGTRWAHVGLAFRGATASGERYGGVFPLAGRFRQQFGFDRVDFLLWPLFARARRNGYTETHLLWPFLAWGSGDGRSLLRIWPFYGVSRRDGVRVRRFFLWPLIHHRVERLDTRAPVRTFYVLPFYGRRDSGPHASRFYLFPLLLRQWSRDCPGAGRIGVLWPFFSRGRGQDGSESLAIRPFYAHSRRPRGDGGFQEKTSALLGLVARTEIRGGDLQEGFWTVLWAGRAGTRREQGREVRRLDLWPLYRVLHVREADGTRHGYLRIPYLVPLRGLEPDGWNRHYNQLLEIYERRWRDHEERSSLLFGLRETRSAARGSWTAWGGLLHLHHTLPVDRN